MSCFTPKNAALTDRNDLENEWDGGVIHRMGTTQHLSTSTRSQHKPKCASNGASHHAKIGVCGLSHSFHCIYAKHS